MQSDSHFAKPVCGVSNQRCERREDVLDASNADGIGDLRKNGKYRRGSVLAVGTNAKSKKAVIVHENEAF